MEEKFYDIGIDAITGTEIMDTLGLHQDDLVDAKKFEKVKDVVAFLKQVPALERRPLMNRIVLGKNVDKLEHFWGFSQLYQQRVAKESELARIKDEISYYER